MEEDLKELKDLQWEDLIEILNSLDIKDYESDFKELKKLLEELEINELIPNNEEGILNG